MLRGRGFTFNDTFLEIIASAFEFLSICSQSHKTSFFFRLIFRPFDEAVDNNPVATPFNVSETFLGITPATLFSGF